MMLFDYKFRNYNIRLVLYALMLNLLGVLLIRSAAGQDVSYVNKQIMGVFIGLAAALFLSLLDYHRVVSAAPGVYAGCILLLSAVLFFGKSVNNATRWLELPVVGQIQPSEFVKVGLIVFFSWLFSRFQEKIDDIRNRVLPDFQ